MVRSTSCWVCLTLLKLLLMPMTRQLSGCMARRPTPTLSVNPPLADITGAITACSSVEQAVELWCEALFKTVCCVFLGNGGMLKLYALSMVYMGTSRDSLS